GAGTAFVPRWFNRWYIYAGIMLLNFAAGSVETDLIRRHIVEAFWFPTGSMQPTLLVGDHFLVDKQAYPTGALPERGDIVVFVSPVDAKTRLVKRAVALAGDKVEIRERTLYVNDVAVNEPYVQFVDS